jgi:hypothetical protein
MEGFLLSKLAHESQSRSDVFGGHVVFTLNLFSDAFGGMMPDSDPNGCHAGPADRRHAAWDSNRNKVTPDDESGQASPGSGHLLEPS